MSSLVLGFQEIKKTQLLLVGGKGLNLGELSKIQGIQVPEGFCVTTVGYQKALIHNETFQALLDQLTLLKVEDRDQIGKISRKIRQIIIGVGIPSDVVKAVIHYLSQFGDEHAYAVRSSTVFQKFFPHLLVYHLAKAKEICSVSMVSISDSVPKKGVRSHLPRWSAIPI